MSGHARRMRRMFDALDELRDEPEVIVVRRCPSSADGVVSGHWVVSTAGHNSHHWHVDDDALLVVKILMEQQREEMP